MANSLRAKLSKLRHDGNITDAEYQALIKKLDGHGREIRNKAIEEFAERLRLECLNSCFKEVHMNRILEIAEEMRGAE